MRSRAKAVAFIAGVVTLLATGVVLAGEAGAATVWPGDPRKSLGAGSHSAASLMASYDPRRLTHLGDAQQLIVVAGESATSSYSTLRTYDKVNGLWVARFDAMAARNGFAGWAQASRRVQGDGTSPWGTFTITDAFGLKANPGTKLKYLKADATDYWVGDNRDPQTYNLVQPSASDKKTWRVSEAERLAGFPTQYEYAAVIDFNRPAPSTVRYDATLGENVTSQPANVAIGSAIFLHINGTGNTAGCVSVARANLLSVLKWLDPAKKPVIVMAPLANLPQA